jgi:hypothetical protein
MDLVLRGPTALDFDRETISFHAPGAPFAEAAGWPSAPFDAVRDLALAHVALDGQPVRLMLDTGSPDVLWLGQQPTPGDSEVDTTDAEGNPIKMYYGQATLTLGAWTGVVPVFRVPSFPYFEQTVRDLGGNIQGLLGLSALGRAFVVDSDARAVRASEP